MGFLLTVRRQTDCRWIDGPQIVLIVDELQPRRLLWY